jgi:hypothetical protein
MKGAFLFMKRYFLFGSVFLESVFIDDLDRM